MQVSALLPSLCQFPSLSHTHSLSLLHFVGLFFTYLLFTLSLSRALSLSPPPTVFRALSMSMPWLQGTAGLARQSPALPRRETSTRWRRRYLKASAITSMASWVNAEVYYSEREREGEAAKCRHRKYKLVLFFSPVT